MITLTFQVATVEDSLSLLKCYEQLQKKDDPEQQLDEFEKKFRAITLDDLVFNHRLTIRSAHALNSENLTDAYSIGKMFLRDSGRTMLKIPNLGKKCIKEIEFVLHEIGFLSSPLRSN